jgi:predicted short-subunit dehydrogenase-like oxidoreductase (DUF2520 family)
VTTGIAGTGRLAQALGKCLTASGESIDAIGGRNLEHAQAAADFIGNGCRPLLLSELQCDRVLIAVSDRAIVEVAAGLTGCAILLHTCGAHGAELLAGVSRNGVGCGSLHPFQTIASPDAGYRVLPGSAFAIDGDPAALAWAEDIVRRLHGVILRIPAQSRAIYHAAAVMASNHVIATLDAATELLNLAGVQEGNALRAIGPIARAVLDNAAECGPVAALTGPVERGDTATVARHLHAIDPASPSVRGLYRAASLQALDMARRRGMDAASAHTLELLLDR